MSVYPLDLSHRGHADLLAADNHAVNGRLWADEDGRVIWRPYHRSDWPRPGMGASTLLNGLAEEACDDR